jgi:hypothetical protein
VTPLPPSSRRHDPTGSLGRAFAADLAAADLDPGPGDATPVTDDKLAEFDEPVRRYLRFMGVVDRPRAWSFRVRLRGRFRRRGDGPWMAAEAWQYNSAIDVARVFTMRVTMARVLPMIGHDTYVRGQGRMVGKLLGVVKVADGSGDEFDIGELVTYLNDAILLSPSMILGPSTTWSAVGDDAFDVALTDRGRTVRARVTIDDRGAPTDFATTDRWADLPSGLVRARWRTPVARWLTVDGRPFPGEVPATWDLDDGPLVYLEGAFEPASFVENVAPTG